MKPFLVCSMLLLMATSLFGQSVKQSLTRDEYLKKSKNQKTAAWVLLGGGVALLGTGILIADSKEASFDDAATGVILGGIGFFAGLGSIPLFIASGKNKRRAMAASAYFKMEKNSAIASYTMKRNAFPALSIRIRL